MRGIQWFVGTPAYLSVAAAAILLAGCGGGGGGSNGGTGSIVPRVTGTFRSSEVSILVGGVQLVHVGRGFVTLNNAVPVEMGLELDAEAVNNIPKPAFDVPVVYGVALPPESVYTPFAFLAFSYWSGHSPRGIGDIPHFHPLIALYPPGQPDPPDFTLEKTPVAPEEIPQDYVEGSKLPGGIAGETVAPGIGVAYEDPVQPQLHPGWDTIGQNYFFYKGHMAGIGLGATNAFLLRQQAGREGALSDVIKQPQVYPKPGYYPHRQEVRYDAARKVHIFALQDFQQAQNVLVQRVRR